MIDWIDFLTYGMPGLLLGLVLGWIIRDELYHRGIVEDRMPRYKIVSWVRHNVGNFLGVFLILIAITASTWAYFIIDDLRDENECLTDAVGDLFVNAVPVRQAGTDGDRALLNLIETSLSLEPIDPADFEGLRQRQEESRTYVEQLKTELNKAIALRERNPIPINPCGVHD